MRNWLKERDELNLWIGRTLKQVARVFPFPTHENRDVWTVYLPHTKYVLSFQEYPGDYEESLRSLLGDVAECFSITGKYTESERIYRQTVELTEKMLGVDHPSTLGSMNNLADVLQEQGKYAEAETM